MNTPDLSENFFIHSLEKSIRHIKILNNGYHEFESEFIKIRNFIINSDSKILRQKFRFLLPQNLKDNSKEFINQKEMNNKLKIIKCLLYMIIHLSNFN